MPQTLHGFVGPNGAGKTTTLKAICTLLKPNWGEIQVFGHSVRSESITVREALEQLRNQAPDSETIYYIYILSSDRRLDGFISLRDLILARPDAVLADICRRDVISVPVDDDQEHVAQALARYDFIAIPVVDAQHRLVGIVTHDDAIDIVQEEATEDAHRQGAVEPLEDSYLETPLLTLAWKRGIWLMLLAVVALMTAAVINHYVRANANPAFAFMIAFLPLVLASGGNAGSQSATLVIRMLALGQMNDEHLVMARREMILGLALGLAVALVGFLATHFFFDESIAKASVVATTVLLVVVLGTLSGAALPVILDRLGADPALMSNPLIAAIVDVVGVVIYYQVAILFLSRVS
jgi:magnesium transporter